ncbi:hypothetical protein A9Q99_08775 [Gammaproteobacteria bacterium 45_16_T64]|nr:hypothetical protein A9Q99_08775 [Gammaproteobacteria bacterium 45_16_T64]
MTHQEDQSKQIDQNGRSTRYGYDDLGRLETVTPEVTISGEPVPDTSYTYDEVGNKLTQTDAEGRTTHWTYDYYGRVLTRKLPEGMTETFVYDDAARTVADTDFNGDTNTTYMDNQGRVDRIEYHDGRLEEFTYWANGQVHTVTVNSTDVTTTVFDDRDRLDHEIKPDGTRLDYQYDDVGNRTQVKVTRGTNITVTDYTYDDRNRLETVIDNTGAETGTTRYTYDAVGSLDTVTTPNGVVADYDYNSVNQLEVLTTKNAAGDVLSSYNYGLDSTGRREDITEANGRFTDYIYDDLYRLTDEIIYVTEGGLETYRANYIYDWVGNRKYETITDGSSVQTEYQYDFNDRLTSQGGTTYTHDDNGNTKTETLDGVITTYFYDAKNKLTSVDKAGVVSSYTYDPNGIRASKTESGVTTRFVVDLNRDYAQVLEEVVNDVATVSYTYGHDLLSQERGGDFRFYSYDGLGSTRALTDGSGVVTDTYQYEANSTGSTENDYLFAGEQLDSETDNYYLRARYMDLSIGRFNTMDSFNGLNSAPATLNKYLYANSDAVNFIDPSGYLSLGEVLSAINVQSRLTTIAGNAGGSAAGRKLLWKGGCFVVEELAQAALENAISLYVFDDINIGKPYVGQSKVSVESRIKKHFKVVRTSVENITAVLSVSVAEGVSDKLEDVLDALEQSFIDDHDGPGGKEGQSGGSANKRNQIDLTKDKRKYLGKLMDKFKICDD